jgi:hypothetical protein
MSRSYVLAGGSPFLSPLSLLRQLCRDLVSVISLSHIHSGTGCLAGISSHDTSSNALAMGWNLTCSKLLAYEHLSAPVAHTVLAQISKFVTAADGIRAGTCSLSGSTLIPMVQTANFWEGHDVAGGRLYGTRPRAVLAERKMCSGVMMVVKIAR